MSRRGWKILGGAAIGLFAVDAASSFISLQYLNWGDQTASRPMRMLRMEAGHLCLVSAAQHYYSCVEWSGDPPSNGWTIEVSRYRRGFWFWQFIRLPDAALARVTLWPIELVLGGIAISAWASARRRRSTGACRSCGYDLSGNVSGRCPECGTAVFVVAATDDTDKHR